jgi:hypothetical protein
MTSSFLRRIVPPGSALIRVALGVNGALTYLFLALAGAALFLALATMSGRTFAAVGVGLIVGSAAVLTGLLWSLWRATDAYPVPGRALIETGP